MISKDIKRNHYNNWLYGAKITNVQKHSFSWLAQFLRGAYEEMPLLRLRGWLFDLHCNPSDIEKKDRFIYRVTFQSMRTDAEYDAFFLCYEDAEKDAVLNDFKEGDLIQAFFVLCIGGYSIKRSQPAYILNSETNHLHECFDLIRMVGMTERGIFPRLSKNKLIEIMASHIAQLREEGKKEFTILRLWDRGADGGKPRLERESDVPRYDQFTRAELVAGVGQSLMTGLSLLMKIGILVCLLAGLMYFYSHYWVHVQHWMSKKVFNI